MSNPHLFRYVKTSPEIIRLAVMISVRYPLSLRNVEDLLHERGIDITHETVRFLWNRFGTIFAAEIRRSRVQAMRHFQHRLWHLYGHCQSKIGLPSEWPAAGFVDTKFRCFMKPEVADAEKTVWQ